MEQSREGLLRISVPPAGPRGRPSPFRRSQNGITKENQRRAFGATSREPDQSLAALTVEVCASPAVGAASPISLGSTWPGLPALGVSSQIYPPSASRAT